MRNFGDDFGPIIPKPINLSKLCWIADVITSIDERGVRFLVKRAAGVVQKFQRSGDVAGAKWLLEFFQVRKSEGQLSGALLLYWLLENRPALFATCDGDVGRQIVPSVYDDPRGQTLHCIVFRGRLWLPESVRRTSVLAQDHHLGTIYMRESDVLTFRQWLKVSREELAIGVARIIARVQCRPGLAKLTFDEFFEAMLRYCPGCNRAKIKKEWEKFPATLKLNGTPSAAFDRTYRI